MRYRLIIPLLALVALVGFGVATAQDAQPVFRIGVLDSPRGSLSTGAALAVRQINQAGGAIGAEGTRFRLELVNAFPAADEDLGDAIDRLREAEVIAVLGPTTTADVLTYTPQLTALGVPVLTPAIGDTVIASDASSLLFRIRAAERLQGSALASLLVNDLNVSTVTTVQLDADSTGPRVGFSTALNDLAGSPEETSRLLEGNVRDFALDVATDQPSVVVGFGEPATTAEFYNALRDAGWVGVFATPQASEPAFRDAVALDRLLGVIGTTTWPVTAVDDRSVRFVSNYVQTTGQAPDAIAAASYDAVSLIARAIGQAGTLRDNLIALRDVEGIQGILNTPDLPPRELSENVAVVQLNAIGGPDTVARYTSTVRRPSDQPAQIGGTPQPSPTATPDGVFITIESARQNVRTGPGTEYSVIGQLSQGETVRVVGANADFSWVVIEFRSQQGWLFTNIADVFGERNSLPLVAIPPTPTPPPATATLTPPPVADVVIVAASPPNLTLNATTNVNVTVRNAGAAPTGPFAIAASFPPDQFYSSASIAGLAPGQETTAILPVTLTGATGNFNVIIVADLNDQVAEGPAGEANNDDFTLNYRLDRQAILINSTSLSIGNAIDLEGANPPINDLTFTASGLECTNARSCIGTLSPTLTFDTATYDAISASNGINQTSIAAGSITPGMVFGIITEEGRRAVARVDAYQAGNFINMTWRVYGP